VIYDDWRIQKHAVIGHYRLVDPEGRRQAYGSFETCLAALDKAKVDHKLPPLPQDVVIVLHGLGAPRRFMNGITHYLQTQGGFYVINFGYPSTMLTVNDYAQSLDSVIRHLDGVKNISFVAHSMGNIVVRRYLKDYQSLTPAMRPQVTFQRMVMISPPNHGAEVADMLGDREIIASLADMVAGDVIKELAPKQGWRALEQQLATPWFPFGIIAGGTGTDQGYLPQIPGDNDGLLSLETQKLAGAADFLQTGGLHQLMPNYEEVRAATLSFLKNGYFVSKEAMQPIPAAAVAAPAESLPVPAATQ
jgi:pimeloyl-ACP methyl ester carboxylesterase